ncbi:aminopeptidase [Halorarius litoreus]|uniref:aminopeptidase n=1 Tax=Halorarius litoreus TaxID=2962676 RepID=UPI0020CE05E0|nr:aminopeptidase [Halorarius litoreus]
MDPRVHTHAETLVDHCTDVGPEDDVLIKAPALAEDLVVALYEQLGERGARPKTTLRSRRAGRAYARQMDEADFRTKEHALAEMEATDVVIMVQAGSNAAETSDIDPSKAAASNRANGPVLEERLDSTRWVITQHPTAADAQRAELSTEAWADTVYDAIDRDWAAQRDRQQRMADRLDAADEVRLKSGEHTDVTMSVAGTVGCNDYGKQNLPGGEAYTSPVPDSVEGTVLFDVPIVRNGREIRNARLTFEGGEVVDYAAERGEEVLSSVLETDAGARRVGELGIGMNRGIDAPTGYVLFDEKMGDTVHLALGNAIEEGVGDGAFNESATHVDLIVDMSEDSVIEVDGEVIQRDGVFWFESGFEA